MSYQCLGCGAKLLNKDECARCDRETIVDSTDENAKLKAEVARLKNMLRSMARDVSQHWRLKIDTVLGIRRELKEKSDGK